MKSMKYIIHLMLISFMSMAGTVAASELEYHAVESDQPLPFSDAVRAGDLLFLSGKIGNVPGTLDLVEGGIAAETRQAMDSIEAAVEKYGSSMDRVVKCTVFLADIGEWAAMNEVYMTYFPNNPPARSALGANGLALDARVEIECIAAVD